ncbi:hypothetical protein [Rhodoblastus sp.]|uniref:hypothetical protein n=1 Tax=Rhodoblastus sp. TaxID=1962975 RepID=UPI003F96916A
MTPTPSTPNWRSVERVSIVAPLGVRFWDPAFDAQVSDGLAVTAWPADTWWPPTPGYLTASGIYAFHGLPGLHDLEYPAGGTPSPASLMSGRTFLIEVVDTASRFLPTAFSVDAPYDGIFPTGQPLPSSVPGPPGFYLFSAPNRQATATTALVRAQISERLDNLNEQPAAYAVLEIDTPDGASWLGIADARGAAAALFPYPTFTGADDTNASLAPSGTSLQQSWSITLRVRYQPSALSFPLSSSPPELRSVLAQAPAAIWTQRASPPGVAMSSLPATLVFGQALTARSTGESVLLVGLGSLP